MVIAIYRQNSSIHGYEYYAAYHISWNTLVHSFMFISDCFIMQPKNKMKCQYLCMTKQ